MKLFQRHTILLIILSLPLTNSLWGEDFNFDKINNRHGLSSDEVADICVDSEGFIWIASNDGLDCYTGTEVINYRHNRNNKNSISSSHIEAICVAHDKRLWIATENGKINILDRQTNKVDHLPNLAYKESTEKPRINNMVSDSKGNIWISTNRGLTRYSLNGEDFKNFNINNRGNYIPIIYETQKGDILCSVWAGGLFKLNEKKGEFERLNINGLNRSTNIKSLLEDKKGNLWIGTWGKGIYKARKNKKGKYKATHSPILNENYSKDNSFQIVYDMVQDKDERIWIGTDVGLGFIDNTEQIPTNITWIEPGVGPKDFSTKDASTLTIDNASNLWIGTNGDGIFRLTPHGKPFTTFTSKGPNAGYGSNAFSSFWYYNDELYTGIRALGFGKYDIETKTFTSYKDLPEFSGFNALKKPINTVIQCEQRDERYLWMATRHRGVIKYDLEERIAYELPNSEIRGTGNVFFLEEKRIWLGKEGGLLVYTYDPTSDDEIFPYTMTKILPEVENRNSIRYRNVSGIMRDKEGQLWISYFNGGLDKVYESEDSNDFIFEPVIEEGGNDLNGIPIQTMYEDERNNIWLGTAGEGLWLFRKKTSQLTNFSEFLSLENKMVFGIVEDDLHRLWVSTNQGIHSFNILNTTPSHVAKYNADDGLQGNIFIRNSVYKNLDGTLMFGGYHGFNYFAPERMQYNSYIPPLAFTKFNVNGEASYVNYSQKEKLTIDHHSTSFSISFAALSYTRSHNNKFQYKLEGYDKEWIKCEKGNSSAIYGKIPSGEYTFKVKGANNNGLWNPEALEVGVYIKKSPFHTFAAYFLYLLLLCGVVWAYIYYSQRNFKLKQAYKEEQSQRSKEHKISQFKLKFFTNISHELLTPLSIISNGLEQFINNNPEEANSLSVVQRNTNRLTRLIKQLLDFRKAESSTRTLMVGKNNIDLQVSALKDNFLALCANKDISFVVNGEVRNDIYFDADKVDKVLHNILSNAFKHTPENGTITLSYSTYFKEGAEFLKMSVSDTGTGIPKKQIDKIFECFYRIDDSENKPGTGIGLAFCKSLISNHKGIISANNDTNGGAIFTFEIPISKFTYSEEELSTGERHTKDNDYSFVDEMYDVNIKLLENNANNSERPKILLVEDNHDMRSILRNFLSQHFEIYESENGLQGLEALSNVDIQLVISDIMMPEMDGLTFCRRVKSNINTSHIPVILTTAKRSDKNYIEGYEAHADSYITKPVNMQLLLVRIVNLLDERNRLHKLFSKEESLDVKELNIDKIDRNLLDKVNQYINKNINEPDLTVVSMAEHVNLSASVLYRKVKAFTGMSPNGYIRTQRLNYSCTLLRKGMKPRDVTYECGFSDPSYYGACFKKQFGMTPIQYIKGL